MTDEQDRITTYTYDDLYQLVRVEYPDSQTVEYTYDPVGNRTGQDDTLYVYDTANRLTEVDSVPYGYDQNGNVITVGDSVYYRYDYENRLTVYIDANGTTEYTYDGDGNRTGQTVTGSVYGSVYETYEYIYDINRGLPNLLVEKNGAVNINNYIYAGRVLSRTGPEGQIFYHQDGLGSITLITDTDGEAINRYEYGAFGSPRSVWETVYNPFLFTGEPYDSNGLIFLRARYYDPTTGRFLSKDTYLGTLNDPLSQNLYAYVGNNPVLYVDPSGHSAICQGGSLTKTWASTMSWLPVADFVLPIGDIIYVGGTVIIGAIEYGPTLVLIGTEVYQARRTKAKERRAQDREISPPAEETAPRSNQAQNEQARYAGKGLTPEQAERFHREVSGKGYTLDDLIRVRNALFPNNPHPNTNIR